MKRSRRTRLGQNFLVDREIAEKIVALLEDEPPRVLEVGPGRGALTEPLLDRFDRVLALELDEKLIPPIAGHFRDRGLDVRHADALTVDLDALLASERRWQVASNLPYSVGSAVVRRLLPRHDLFTRLVVMLQREVALRVVAEPAGSGHGLLALERAAFAEARILFDVPPGAFRPRPKVVSSVLQLDLRPPESAPDDLERALALAARALTMPRKTLTNALRGKVAAGRIEAVGLDPSARPGTVPLEAWVRLVAAT